MNGVTSFMNMRPVPSPARSSLFSFLPKRAETREQPETGFKTPADRLQNPNTNSARDRIIKTRDSANVNPRSSLRKCVDSSRPKKRISFDIVCSKSPGRSPPEVLDDECKKKKAKMAEPELILKKRRPVSERLPKLVLPPEMKTNPAYTPIDEDIPGDSYWINVLDNLRRPPEVQRDVQAIRRIKKGLKKLKKNP
jgi:hypothetical protein